MNTVGRYVICSFFLWAALAGCAGLPVRLPLSASDNHLVRESFKEMVSRQQQCKSSVDAEMTVTLVSRFYSGTMSGYLQAKAPSSVKIVGINPLGQPLVVLVSDAVHFNYAVLNESRNYSGDVNSAAFRRYAPPGFDPGSSFYTLTGKLPPGEVRILAASRDQKSQGYWVEIQGVHDNIRRLVLFDPDRQLIIQYLQFDAEGDQTLQIAYSDYFPGVCSLPGRIDIASSDRAAELLVRLRGWQTDNSFSAADFELELPPDFKRVRVN